MPRQPKRQRPAELPVVQRLFLAQERPPAQSVFAAVTPQQVADVEAAHPAGRGNHMPVQHQPAEVAGSFQKDPPRRPGRRLEHRFQIEESARLLPVERRQHIHLARRPPAGHRHGFQRNRIALQEKVRADWWMLGVTGLAGCLLSSMGIMLTPVFVGLTILVVSLKKKSISCLAHGIAACIPCIILGIYYIYLTH